MSDARLRELERAWRDSGSEADEVALLRAQQRAGELSEGRIALAAHLGHAPAQQVSGHEPGRWRGVWAWLEGAPKEAEASSAPGPRASLQAIADEVRGVDAELDAHLGAALADPQVTSAVASAAQRVSSAAVVEKLPRAVEIMNELIALMTAEAYEQVVLPGNSEVTQRGAIAAVHAMLRPVSPELSARLELHRQAARDPAPPGRPADDWLRSVEEDAQAVLLLEASEWRLLGLRTHEDECLSGSKHCDGESRAFRAAHSLHGGLEGLETLPEALRLAARRLGVAAVREAIRSELIPWALGRGDPVRARVEEQRPAPAPSPPRPEPSPANELPFARIVTASLGDETARAEVSKAGFQVYSLAAGDLRVFEKLQHAGASHEQVERFGVWAALTAAALHREHWAETPSAVKAFETTLAWLRAPSPELASEAAAAGAAAREASRHHSAARRFDVWKAIEAVGRAAQLLGEEPARFTLELVSQLGAAAQVFRYADPEDARRTRKEYTLELCGELAERLLPWATGAQPEPNLGG